LEFRKLFKIDLLIFLESHNNFKDLQNENAHLKDAEDEFVDDSGYTVSSHKNLDRSISSADIELANKINILKKSGLI